MIGEGRIAIGRFGLQRRDGGVDGDRIGDGADLELDIKASFIEGLENDVFADDAAEAIAGDTEGVGSGFEQGRVVEAEIVGGGDDAGVFGQIRDGDGGRGHGGTGRIGDVAGDAGADLLSERSGTESEKEQGETEHSLLSVPHKTRKHYRVIAM